MAAVACHFIAPGLVGDRHAVDALIALVLTLASRTQERDAPRREAHNEVYIVLIWPSTTLPSVTGRDTVSHCQDRPN